MQKVTEFVTSQHWPFLQICEKIVFDNAASGRGVVATTPINKHEVVCDYHTDVIITQSVMCQRENTQYILDCGDIVFDATLDTCECHPGRRTFGRLLNYRPDNHPQCNVRMKRMVINGKNAILFIAKRDIDALGEICFDYKDPKYEAEFSSRPVTVSSDPPTSGPPTSDPPTSDPPNSDPPTSDLTSNTPSSEPVSDPPTVEHVQETSPQLCNDSTIFDDSPIY